MDHPAYRGGKRLLGRIVRGSRGGLQIFLDHPLLGFGALQFTLQQWFQYRIRRHFQGLHFRGINFIEQIQFGDLILQRVHVFGYCSKTFDGRPVDELWLVRYVSSDPLSVGVNVYADVCSERIARTLERFT